LHPTSAWRRRTWATWRGGHELTPSPITDRMRDALAWHVLCCANLNANVLCDHNRYGDFVCVCVVV
jgi:hypothetical protein